LHVPRELHEARPKLSPSCAPESSISAGAIALTRMPFAARARAASSVNPASACFDSV